MKGSAVCALFVLVSFAFLEADANMQSRHLESKVLDRKRRAVLNDAEKVEVLKAHNDVRQLEGSSDMEILTWNDDLATMAEAWAEKCQWYHGQAISPPPGLASMGYTVVGQNLYAISGVKSIDITSITRVWYDEKGFYNYDYTSCEQDKMCGHYTQIVWANTNLIGCAYYKCPTLNTTELKDAFLFVCNYAPPGNYIGQKPFKKGSACTQCASNSNWCNSGLCDKSCASGKPGCVCYAPTCQSTGTLNTDKCTCECQPYYCGSDCSSVYCAAVDVRSLTMTAKVTITLSLTILWLFRM